MNKKMILHTLGYILLATAVLLLPSIIVSLIYGERCVWSFAITAGISAAAGFILLRLGVTSDRSIHSREGFVIVALAWIAVSALGALPFIISGTISDPVDALFETISGFTTTGATILTEIESLPRGILFWRSFTHWIGGMGVLVFVLSVLPMTSSGAVYLIRAEMPGPTPGKLVPRLKDTAKILYLIYIGLTVLMIIMLLFGGLSLYDSLIHTFGAAGTGGYSNWNNSVAHYQSGYVRWVIAVFMLLFGVNFNLYYMLLLRSFRSVFKNDELRVYLGIVLLSTAVITLNILRMYDGFGAALSDAFFQVSSIITTTGYTTANYDMWPELSKSILVLLMFIGACAGSTGGGIKVSRLILMGRIMRRGIRRLLHPRAVDVIKLDGKTVDDNTVNGAGVYLMTYVGIACAVTVLISVDGFPFAVNFSAMAACFNNIGPGLDAVGAVGNYAAFSWFSKLILSFAMLAGRLEIFPLLILFTRGARRAAGPAK